MGEFFGLAFGEVLGGRESFGEVLGSQGWYEGGGGRA